MEIILSIELACYCLMISNPLAIAYNGKATHLGISPGFTKEEEAAKAAADIYNPISIQQDREFMGAILFLKGSYYFSVTAGNMKSDAVTIRVPKREWNHVVALWHTHGREDHRHRFFSEVDTALVNELGKPFYLADYTGILKVFRPGDPTLDSFKAAKLGLPKQRGYALGIKVRDASNRVIKVNTGSVNRGSGRISIF